MAFQNVANYVKNAQTWRNKTQYHLIKLPDAACGERQEKTIRVGSSLAPHLRHSPPWNPIGSTSQHPWRPSPSRSACLPATAPGGVSPSSPHPLLFLCESFPAGSGHFCCWRLPIWHRVKAKIPAKTRPPMPCDLELTFLLLASGICSHGLLVALRNLWKVPLLGTHRRLHSLAHSFLTQRHVHSLTSLPPAFECHCPPWKALPSATLQVQATQLHRSYLLFYSS